ncbi:hypothetical protein [Fredinandcohnia sp. 179-A 10B2 NHS]|uniref:hypothetical protein n=1 Tax=Fredinandcohnia sp. 179-A 10B2 NHS TaxID=3235176 RepID=UPI0039A008BC
MNRYLKLVNFEFTRFLNLYLVLMGITIVSQLVGMIYESRKYMGRANEQIYKELLPVSDFLDSYGEMSFVHYSQTIWFMGPVVVCGIVLMIYVFFIWYRDWLGKNTFSYRLLVLPTERINIYLAKATAILLFVLGFIALQLLLIPVESQILKWMIPNEFRMDLSINEITSIYFLAILFPKSFIEFILYYGTGMAAVFIAFTAIMFERSYRLKGILYAILYIAVAAFVFLAPLLVNAFILEDYFYTHELFFMELGTGLLVLAGTIWTGNFLIKNKIRV